MCAMYSQTGEYRIHKSDFVCDSCIIYLYLQLSAFEGYLILNPTRTFVYGYFFTMTISGQKRVCPFLISLYMAFWFVSG